MRPRPAPSPAAVRAGLLCGLAAPLLWAATIALAGAARPGFDHFGQYISELAERGSATASLMRYAGFGATGLLHLGFALALRPALGRLTGATTGATLVALLVGANGVGRIGAGVFSCAPGCAGDDAEQQLHRLAATTAFFALIAACAVAATIFRRHPGLRPLAAYSLATSLAGFGFLAWMTQGGAVPAGLAERLASGVLSLWVFVTAARLRALYRR